MGKKSKKKTIASTRKVTPAPEAKMKKQKKEGFFAKLFKKKSAKSKAKANEKAAKIVAVLEKAEKAKIIAAAKAEKAAVAGAKIAKKEQEKKEAQIAAAAAEKKAAHAAQVAAEKPKREAIKRLPISAADKQRFVGITLVFVGTLALIFVAVFLFNKIFRAETLANLLPADSTVGFLEANIDGNSQQPQQFFQLLKKYPVYQKDNLVQLANLILPLDFEKDLSPWIGRKAGVAFVKAADKQGQLQLVFFVESKNSAKTIEFLKNRVLKNSKDALLDESYNGATLYTYKNAPSYNFAFLNNYLVATGNKTLLQQLINDHNNPTLRLVDETTFRKVANNLPQGGLAFAYMNMQKLFEELLKNPAFASQKGRDFVALQPFLKIFSAEGFTVFADDKQLKIQQFSNIDRTQLGGATYLTYNDKYQGKLLELAEEAPIFFVGGHDLNKELNRLEEIFNGGTKASALIFEGLLEAQKQKYLGKDLSLTEDIYPLLKGEYSLTIAGSFDQPHVAAFLELNNQATDLARIEKITNAFIKVGAMFEPHLQEVTLPDGTKGQEVVASPELVTRSDSTYQGVNVTSLQLGNLSWGIHYAVIDNVWVITNNLDMLKKTIDRSAGRLTTNFKNSDYYVTHLEPALRTADEVLHLKIGALTDILGIDKNPILKSYLLPLASLTVSKNFFDDGISTIYLVDIL